MMFIDALRAAGLHPRDVVPDGKIRRCTTESKPTKRNGWHVLHEDGRGFWGDWTSGTGEALGHWKDEKAEALGLSFEVRERLQQQRQRERARRVTAVRAARAFWGAAQPMRRLHPYLERKGLSALGCAWLRVHDGLLVVPVWHGEYLVSVQTISPEGEKRFWTGAPVKGGALTLARPRAALTAVCEGLATGLATYQSVRQASVIVAFDAGNLLPVVQRLRPSGTVCIVADNDHGTLAKRGFNPGVNAARNAADLIGCGVAYPEGIEGTDIADCLKEWGEGAQRRVERLILGQARYVPAPVP